MNFKKLFTSYKKYRRVTKEPPKPVRYIRPITESFKPLDEQKDSSLARLAFTLNPALRITINEGLAKKKVNTKILIHC